MNKTNPTTNIDEWTWVDLGVRNDLIDSFYLYEPGNNGNVNRGYKLKWPVREQLNKRSGQKHWSCMIAHQSDGRLKLSLGFANSKDAVWAKLQWGTSDA